MHFHSPLRRTSNHWVFALMLEAVFLIVPMICASAVFYDIAVNGMDSVFLITALCATTICAIFMIVRAGMRLVDSVIEDIAFRRKRRRQTASASWRGYLGRSARPGFRFPISSRFSRMCLARVPFSSQALIPPPSPPKPGSGRP